MTLRRTLSLGIEARIRKYTDDDFDRARHIFRLFQRAFRAFPSIARAFGLSDDAIATLTPAVNAVLCSMNAHEWRMTIFVNALTLAKSEACKDISPSDLEAMMELNSGEFVEVARNWLQICYASNGDGEPSQA